MIIIPKEKFAHPENMEKILEAINEFYEKDMFFEGEEEQMIANLKELLRDEPAIYEEYIKPELCD